MALFVNTTWYFDTFDLKGGLGYGYNGNYDLTGATVVHGDEYLISGGGDYKINDTMKVGGVLVYQSRAEDKYEMPGGFSMYSAGINTLDLIPSFSWFYTKYNVELNASASIPVADSWNTDNALKPMDDPDRSVKFSISASKPF